MLLLLTLFVAAHVLAIFAVYGGIILLTLGLSALVFSRPIAPTQEDVRSLGETPEALELAQHRRALDGMQAHWQKVFESGLAAGFDPRNGGNDDTPRFDERRRGAKAKNQELERLDREINNVTSAIRELELSLSTRFEALRDDFGLWRKSTSRRRALGTAAAVYVCTVGFFVLFGGGPASDASRRIAGFIWVDAAILRPYYAALAAGTLTSFIAGGVTWALQYRRIGDPLSELIGTGAGQEEPDFEASSQSDETNEGPDWDQPEADHVGTTMRRWFDVLGVSSDASPDEIKHAWREAVRQYHPDLVAGLGSELKDLAERKTKELNAAYEEGLRR